MNSDTPENGSNGSENGDPWDVETLRDLLPSSLGSEGTRAAICAIRNPDANSVQIAEKCGLASSYTVGNALRSLLVGTVDEDPGAGGAEMMDLRGEAREAEGYGELTEKQQAVIDFAAEHPQFVDERTYGEVSQAISEQEGVAVGETYVGRVLRQYEDILARRRAKAAAEGENEQDLEAVTTDMTVREMLEAAGYDLPDENLDEMPEVDVDIPEGEDATLGDGEQAEAEFERASEVEGEQEEDMDTTGTTFLDDGWLEQHADIPGADRATRLPEDAEDEDVKQNTPYWAYVNGTQSYGVFVSLTNPAYGDDVSGLVAEERLYGTKAELERGDPLVVELDHVNGKGLAFTDWRLRHPEVMKDEAEVVADEGDSEAEQDVAEGTEDEDEQQEQPDTAPDEGAVVPGELVYRLEGLERAVDTLREDAVFASEVGEFASEVGEFASEVEARIDALREDLNEMEGLAGEAAHLDEVQALEDRVDTVETAQAGTVEDALEVAEREAEAREALEQRTDSLQEMVNGLAETVQTMTEVGGTLGRAQRALQRLEQDDAQVQAYEYSEQDGTVTLHVEADVGGHGHEQTTLEDASDE